MFTILEKGSANERALLKVGQNTYTITVKNGKVHMEKRGTNSRQYLQKMEATPVAEGKQLIIE